MSFSFASTFLADHFMFGVLMIGTDTVCLSYIELIDTIHINTKIIMTMDTDISFAFQMTELHRLHYGYQRF